MDIGALEAAAEQAVADDRETPWSDAWKADQMAMSDGAWRRVTNDEECCGGQLCMHYVRTPVARVRGRGAAKPSGNAISLADALMILRGRGAAK